MTEIKCKVCISSCIFLHIFFVFFISLISYSFNVLCMLYSCVNVCDRAVRKHPTNAVPSSWGLCFFFWGGVLFLLICFNHFIVQIHKFLLLREVHLSAPKKNCVFVVYWMLCSSFHITQCLLLSLAGGELGCTSGWQREI